MSIDITRRRQAEQALAESELRYRTLAETVPDSLSVSDPDGNITYASPSALRLFGNKSENELVGRNVFEWIPGAEHERAAADMRKILAGGTLLGEEYRLAKSDGSLFHGAVSATALRDPSGRPSGIVVLIRDISERKEAQEALRRSEERYHALAQAAHDIIFIARADGTLEYANDEAARRFRTTPKAIVGQRMTELLSSSGAQQEQSVRAVLETGDPLYRENLFHLPDGPAWLGIWLISLRDEEGRVTAVLAQARDITERKEKEQAVAAAKLRLELALEQSRISIWEADVRTGIVYLSREWQATLGAENAEETFTTLTELLKLVPLEDLPGMRTAIVNVLKGTHPRYSVEHRVRALDGSWKWIHSHGRVIERDARGRALRLAGTNTDISENKRVEAAVQESEAKFRTLVEQSLVGIYIIQDGRFVYVNQRCAEIHGRTVEEMLRLPSVFDVVTPPDRQAVRERIARCISGGVTSTNYAFSIQRKDGQVRELEVFGSRTDLEGRPAIIGTALDVTERRQRQLEIERLNTELEERVAMRTSQLEAANRELEAFSYSVSHDLRAPLRHISGFVKLLEGEAGPALAGRSLEYFEEVTNAALRMGKLIDNLLDFARIGKLELSKRPLSLEGIFKEVAGSLANECAGRKVVWRFGALPEVSADPTLLRQAIWNLLSNAVKYTRTCSEAVIEVGCFRDDHQSVTCYVRDNGAGFDAKYAHKLFGVFQRLHPTAQFEGTGIGLANVQRIVHRHGGKVWGEGKVNAGATFYFSLPKS
jgi:PAS domain S-box-containing protein